MKYLILIIIVSVNSGSLIAQNSKFDTLVNVMWIGTAWQNYSRTINDYDADCRLKTTLHQNWYAARGIWINYSIKTYNYVSGNYIGEILTQLWFNNSWADNYRVIYTYNTSFKILSIVGQNWSSDHWSNYTFTSNKYDKNGYADSVLVQLSHADLPFENSSLATNIYNSDGTLQQTINKNWNVATSSWNDYSKNSFVYNNHKTIDTATTDLWNYNTALWQSQGRSVYTYTITGKLFHYVTQQWQTGQWVNQLFYTDYYDNNGFLSNVLVEQWDGFDFEKYTQASYKNNSDGSIYQHASQLWDENLNTWVNDFEETYSYPASCRLPLQFLLFTATKNDNTVNLKWQTSNEINIAHFTIQRKPGDSDFINVHDISAGNSAGTNLYADSDNIQNITADTIYYRLQIVDKDGSSTYSNTVTVPVALSASTNASGLKVYPNPVKDQLFILFSQNTGKAEFRIIDITGKILYNNTVNSSMSNSITINVSSLSKGMYYVLMLTDNNIQRTKFIKQ
jgi:hypothetical protein